MQELLRYLNYQPQLITEERFRKWQRDPVTREFFYDLFLSFFQEASDPLPSSTTEGTPVAYRRDGMREVVESCAEWAPESVLKQRLKEANTNDEQD